MMITPYAPVPVTNGEECGRLKSSSMFDAIVELILYVQYNGIASPERRESLD